MITRFCLQRFLGFVYLIAFLIAANQILPLVGERGLLPIRLYLTRLRFWDAPSLFWLNSSDRALLILAWTGVALSFLAISGLSDAFGWLFSAVIWGLLWLIYLSFVNGGQVFYGFGWEILLLETGFLAIFLGSSNTPPSATLMWLVRWILFRVMFGAGLIKLRGDPCWRDLTCLFYHYETQPLPNPLSWYFHHLPPVAHKASVLWTHFVELIVPWGLFFPGAIGYWAGGLTAIFQISLILSGNLSWLNYITLVLCVACFDDRFFASFLSLKLPDVGAMSLFQHGMTIALAIFILALSIQPVVNLFSSRQIMNTSFDLLHLVNTYGAFGSVTKVRNEIVIEGTSDPFPTESARWREYEFKGKPGNVARAPCVVSPYHYKIDWQMWFAAMSEYWYHPWFLNLVSKLFQGDPKALSLLAKNPFPKAPPKYIRARLYEYRFTTFAEKRKTGHWWKRDLVGEYLSPLSLESPRFQEILRDRGWL